MSASVEQRVQVVLAGQRRPLTYAWRGAEPLAVGDQVLVPTPTFADHVSTAEPWRAEVVATESNYVGRLVAILRRAD